MPFEQQLRHAAEELEAAKKRRDEMIVKASEAGVTRRNVASATGLSVGRVQQIIAAQRVQKR